MTRRTACAPCRPAGCSPQPQAAQDRRKNNFPKGPVVLLPSPLYSGERGSGVRGLRQTTTRCSPLTPDPSPPRTGERGARMDRHLGNLFVSRSLAGASRPGPEGELRGPTGRGQAKNPLRPACGLDSAGRQQTLSPLDQLAGSPPNPPPDLPAASAVHSFLRWVLFRKVRGAAIIRVERCSPSALFVGWRPGLVSAATSDASGDASDNARRK